MISTYYKLAKPGIVYGNVLTTIAAFLFAWRWQGFSLHLVLLFGTTIIGISAVIASGCVFNNYLDRGIDAKMPRTKNRSLVTGAVSVRNALIYGAVLGIFGFALLVFLVNYLTALLALVGFIFYVFIYAIAKRTSHLGALVGSIPGAVPIVVGYTAVTDRFDLAALSLFLILVLWQLPHFYAIALYRMQDYVAAGLPVFPAVKGVPATKVHILSYLIAFILVVVFLWAWGYVRYIYLVLILAVSGWWLYNALQGFSTMDDIRWAKSIFRISLIVLLVFCAAIAVGPVLP